MSFFEETSVVGVTMKTHSDIENRLQHLRLRYTQKYVSKSQERCYLNCRFNYKQVPRGTYQKNKSSSVPMASRRNVTLVVIQPEKPIHICMYGSDDPANWPGSICDSDDVAKKCSWFNPLKNANDARAEFDAKLADDEYIFENHRDIATLQWVLGDGLRVHKMKMPWWMSILLWFRIRRVKVLPPAPQDQEPAISSDLWDVKK